VACVFKNQSLWRLTTRTAMWIPTAASARPRSRCPASSGWRIPARHGPSRRLRRGSGRLTAADIPRHVQNGCRLPSQRRARWCGPSRLPAPRNTQNGCTCRGPWPHSGLAPLDPPRIGQRARLTSGLPARILSRWLHQQRTSTPGLRCTGPGQTQVFEGAPSPGLPFK
jgi:hypothetical protein